MTDTAISNTKPALTRPALREPTAWDRLKVNRNWLSIWFMLPAAAFLILFLAYPLGLGVWLSFTDAKIGSSGSFVGVDNYTWLLGSPADWAEWVGKLWSGGAGGMPGDSVFWLSVFNTLLYTGVA